MTNVGVGDLGITIRQVAEVFNKLKVAYESKDDLEAEDCLEGAKRKLIFFPTYLNVNAASPTRAQEIMLAREILEHAVLLFARKKDMSEVERHYSMLRTYYFDVAQEDSQSVSSAASSPTPTSSLAATSTTSIPESTMKYLIMGLNLMRLLICHRVAEFHSELERVDAQHQQRDCYIRFAAQMERFLMEGSYNKLLHARYQAPSNEYLPVVELLEGTVRQEVARCLPAAYATITVEDAQQMMMLKSAAETNDIADRRNWSRSNAKDAFVFQRDGIDASKRELPFMQVLQQNIQFVAELQRVV
mmetsp:Transcript_52391/g.60183  ORF Transcript_52391/g.60183 Transcript_52391/m.60183 type:complete len:302 (+) Transcript_52391:43-948(+)